MLYGRTTAGTGRGEELTPSDVRTLLSVYTVTQTDAAISTAVNNLIGGSPGLLDTLDELAAALGDDANFASTVTTALAGKVNTSDLSESIDDRVAALLVAGTNITLTYNDAAGTLTVASTAGGLSGTGSVDNAVLRADGTGGATLQSSALTISDLATSSPNNTVNNVSITPTGGTTNVSLTLLPKGSGALTLRIPSGTAAGGNARGTNAVDLQSADLGLATQVASGASSFTVGQRNTASGRDSFAGGYESVASGTYDSFAFGERATASGSEGCVAIGSCVSSTANFTFTSGSWSLAARHGMWAHAGGRFSASGDCQEVGFIARNVTTSAVATELFLDGSSTRLTIPSGKVLSALVRVTGVKSDGSEVIKFLRDVTIKNVGGTTSLEAAIVTIGTDINVGAATLDLSADNTNDSLKIAVTPPTGTWRWAAVVEVALEIAYGT